MNIRHIRNIRNIREHGKKVGCFLGRLGHTGEDGRSESLVRSGDSGVILDMQTYASLSYMRSWVAILTFFVF